MILYVRSERAAYAARTSRKVSAIHDQWRDLGYDVEMVCGGDVLDGTPSGGAAGAAEGGAVEPRPPGRWSSNPDLEGLAAPLVHSISELRDIRHDRVLLQHLRRRMERGRPQLVWHRASRLHLAPLRAAQEFGVPYVLEWIDHLVSYDHSLFRRRALAADRERMRAAFRIVVVSEVWKQEVARDYEVDPARLVVAHNAVYPDEFRRDAAAGARIRERMGIPADALVVGFVGSYAWFHQTHLVAEAAAVLRERGVGSVYWLMVGDGPHRAEFDARVAELGVEDRVLCQGRVPGDEVSEWLSAMDAAVVMSIGADIICPVKVPEYMAAGLAPIVADMPAYAEVVDHERTGLRFRAFDPAAMADEVARLAASPGRAAELGEAARREVADRFTWRVTWGAALERIAADAQRELGAEPLRGAKS